MLKLNYFLADIFILSAEKQPIKLSWRKIEWLHFSGLYIVLKVFVIVFQRQEWIIIQVFCVDRISFCLMYESTYL